MSIMEIRDCGEVVIGALVEAELREQKLIVDDGKKEFTVDDDPSNENHLNKILENQSLILPFKTSKSSPKKIEGS